MIRIFCRLLGHVPHPYRDICARCGMTALEMLVRQQRFATWARRATTPERYPTRGLA